MANICENTIVLFSTQRDELQCLYNVVQGIIECNSPATVTAVLEKHQIDNIDPWDEQVIYNCSSLSKKEGYFYFYLNTKSKWCPCMSLIETLLMECYRTIEFYYCSAEPGCSIFINTDRKRTFLDAKYYLDIDLGYDAYIETFPTLGSLKKFLTKEYGITFKRWEPHLMVEKKIAQYMDSRNIEGFVRVAKYDSK